MSTERSRSQVPADAPTYVGPEPSDTTLDPNDRLPTGSAPSFRVPAKVLPVPTDTFRWAEPGARLDDFEIVRELGSGASGRVYLARQLSLDRCVALKVTLHRGHEGQTLAQLEHEHIVRVFSETLEPVHGLRLLCMQYVAGTTLDRVIRALANLDTAIREGRAILQAIDLLCTEPTAFDPTALRDRETLGACDSVEAMCWLGGRLALALAHAHEQGVLHRDIKPANILLTRYGRPLLADFNMAFDPRRAAESNEVGGTLVYMAPEHLDAFNAVTFTPAEAVDQRSDIFSLGIVLFELVAGERPFRRQAQSGEEAGQFLGAMAAERRTGAPAVPADGSLAQVIARCLAPEPSRRYQSAAELVTAFEACNELHALGKRLGNAGTMVRAASRHPLLWMLALGLFPHVVGSVVNCVYNFVRILPSEAQRAEFGHVTLAYNGVVYPFALIVFFLVVTPIYRSLKLDASGEVDNDEAARTRRRLMGLPLWVALLSAIGWLPGGIIFPLAMRGSVGADGAWHFFVSFTISGLIALTYSVLAVQFIALRVLYPRFWGDGSDLLRGEAEDELRSMDRRLLALQILAGAIPLVAAVLMVNVGPEGLDGSRYREFRILVTALITLGTVGFTVAVWASNFLTKTVSAITGRRSGQRSVSA